MMMTVVQPDTSLERAGALLMAVCMSFLITTTALITDVAGEQAGPTNQQTLAPSGSLTDQEKTALIGFARKAIGEYLDNGSRMEVPLAEQTSALREQKGCFVTLKKHGVLRGCIGYLLPREGLCDCVVSNAISAAVHDHRFAPVTTGQELDTLDIEISVLSVPQALSVTGPEEVLLSLVPGRDGVILKQGRRQSTYLPQVWEHFPEKEDFLRSLCRKGGMSPDCWKDSTTEVYLYRAEVLHEKKY